MTIETRQLELFGLDPLVLRLRRFRRAHRIRQAWMAKQLGITCTYLMNLELGRNQHPKQHKAQALRARVLARVAAYLENPQCPFCGSGIK